MKRNNQYKNRTSEGSDVAIQYIWHQFAGVLAFTVFLCLLFASEGVKAAAYTWSGTTSTNWNINTNWSPNGIPTAADNVTIGVAANQPVLSSAVTVTNLTLNSSSNLNLNGFLFICSGTFTMATGATLNLSDDTLELDGTAAINGGTIMNSGTTGLILANTTSCTFGNAGGGPTINTEVYVRSNTLTTRNTTFGGITYLEKTGTGNDASVGNNTFNGFTTLVNSSTSAFFLMANTTRDIFNADLALVQNGTNVLYIGQNDATGTLLEGNVTIGGTGTGSIRFGQSAGTCVLASGKTISVAPSGFAGSVYLRNFTQTGSTAQNLTQPTGTSRIFLQAGLTFNGVTTINFPQVNFNGATFNDSLFVTKNGATNNNGSGNNTFNSYVSITHAGTGNFLFSNTTRDVFNGDVNVTCTGSGTIHLAYNDPTGTPFNGNITVNCSSIGSIRFAQNLGTCTLANGKTISVGGAGFSAGSLYLRNLTQVGSTAQSLSFTGTAAIYLQTGVVFNGSVSVTAPTIRLDGSTYNSTAVFLKTGTTGDAGLGGNTFNNAVTFTVTGSGFLQTNGGGNDVFNGNIIVENTGGGIRFGQTTGTCTLASGFTISLGPMGFSAGSLYIRSFIQSGSEPLSLALTGTSSLYLQTLSVFNGNVDFSAPQLFLNGSTYNGTAILTKNGGVNNNGSGANTFNSTATLINSGTGYLLTANTTRDVFNGDLFVQNQGSSLIYLAYNDNTGTLFNGNISVSSTNGTGVNFGGNTGTATLASGKIIYVGTGGFTNGTLTLRNFYQSGVTSQTITLGGTATLGLGPASVFDGDVTASASAVQLNGATYNRSFLATKTGSTNDNCTGNNVFNGFTILTLSGTGNWTMCNSSRDIANGEITFTNNSTGILYVAHNDAIGTQFNDNVLVSTSSTGSIRFGQGTGISSLAAGKVIVTTGPFTGALYLRNFTQLGTTAQSLGVSTGTASLYCQTGTVFNADVTFNFPQLFLNGSTFNGNTTLQKNGATTNTSSGGNTFNGSTMIINSGTGAMYLGNTTADDFNANVTFRQSGSGVLSPAYNTNSTFSGDVSTIGTTTAITFSTAGGSVVLNGSSLQTINGDVATPPVFRRLTMNGTGGVNLNVQTTVSIALTLTSGIINSSSTYLLIMSNASTVSGANNSSYVNGPVRKVGNQAFTFPTGKVGYYRPIAISNPSVTSDHFTAEYFPVDPNSSWDVTQKDATIDHISRCEYWVLNRTNGTSTVNVTLSWNVLSCGVTVLADLLVTRWDNVLMRFRDLGNAGTTGTTVSGTVVSVTAPTAYGTFTFGSNSGNNPLPVELTGFSVHRDGETADIRWSTASELNCDYFSVEKSRDGEEYMQLGRKEGNGTTSVSHDYAMTDEQPFLGLSYYRLVQTDLDGRQNVYPPVKFIFDSKENLSISPNPFSEELRINFSNSPNELVRVKLNDPCGKTVIDQEVFAGSETISISSALLAGLNSGIYFLSIETSMKEPQILRVLKR